MSKFANADLAIKILQTKTQMRELEEMQDRQDERLARQRAELDEQARTSAHTVLGTEAAEQTEARKDGGDKRAELEKALADLEQAKQEAQATGSDGAIAQYQRLKRKVQQLAQ